MSMFTVVTSCPIITTTAVLGPECISNWDDVFDKVGDDCQFVIEVGDVTYSGSIGLASDGLVILFAFNEEQITLPSNSCFTVTCPDVGDDNDADGDGLPDYCNNTEPTTLTDETKLSILDDDGCPSGFVTFGTLKDAIIEEVKGNIVFCDLYPNGIPQGPLVVSDRIVTVTSGCDLKSVPTSDISCDE